jgi:hypothetical protein
MSHRSVLRGVVELFRHDHAGAKVSGTLKGFVPSDRIVRYLAEVQRRKEGGMKPRPSVP